MRVVSLVPSATETLLALGVTPIGVTRFCEHPELPQVGGTKNPDIGAIVALAPDLVVLCEEENRKEDAEALAAAGVATCALAIDAVDDASFAVAALAGLTGTGSHDAVRSFAIPAAARVEAVDRVRAFVPIWRRPWMTSSGATYGSSLLAHLGIDNVFADATTRYPEVELEQVAARRPDVVLAPSEPYEFKERHVAELREVAPVELIDGQDLFWWGIRTPAAIDRLALRLRAWVPGP
jgi:ABC-type Fe3+-hydroxamate transport system substrate-binding protein